MKTKLFIILALVITACPLQFGRELPNTRDSLKFEGPNDSLKISLLATIEKFDHYTQNMDADSIALMYTADALVMNGANMSIKGRDSIRTFLKTFDGVLKVSEQHSVITEIKVSGDTAAVKGHFNQKVVILSTNKELDAHGALSEVWVLQHDGKWLLMKMATR